MGGVALGRLPFLVHVEQVVALILKLVLLALLVDTTLRQAKYFVDVTYYFQLHHYEIS